MSFKKSGKAEITGVLDPKESDTQLQKRGTSKQAFVDFDHPIHVKPVHIPEQKNSK